ncbi:MAG: hydrogenase maturation protease [Micromonosporaceae bacterium]
MRSEDFWAEMQTRGPASVVVGGVRVREGSRVRLRPRAQGDILDLALDGRVAVVERVEQDDQGKSHLAVTVEDDPGRDLGDARMPGHRFFFALEDVEPLGDAVDGAPRILVAGIGNVFLGDDGFGVEVVRKLAGRPLPPGVDVVDFGIRGMDLAYALQRDYQAVVFVDASPRGEPPGTLTVLEPALPDSSEASVQTHGMDPVSVLRLAQQVGQVPPVIRVLCCEPQTALVGGADEDVVVELSPPVRAALDPAAGMVESLLSELADELTAADSRTAVGQNGDLKGGGMA